MPGSDWQRVPPDDPAQFSKGAESPVADSLLERQSSSKLAEPSGRAEQSNDRARRTPLYAWPLLVLSVRCLPSHLPKQLKSV